MIRKLLWGAVAEDGHRPLRALQAPLEQSGAKVHLIGGAYEAGELDAKRAIDQAARLAEVV